MFTFWLDLKKRLRKPEVLALVPLVLLFSCAGSNTGQRPSERPADKTVQQSKRVGATLSRWVDRTPGIRSEERRVGKECRSRWSPYH